MDQLEEAPWRSRRFGGRKIAWDAHADAGMLEENRHYERRPRHS
jgi:hypothetical protein